MLEHIVGAQRRSTPPSNLTEVIRDVKSRWRMKLAPRGAVRSVAVAVAVSLSPPTRSNGHGFSPSSIIAAAGAALAAVLGSVFYFLIRPLRRRVTDEQVALYLEEHEPSLQATLMSAVEASGQGGGESASPRSFAGSSSRRSRRARDRRSPPRRGSSRSAAWGIARGGCGCRDR